ncbi:DUF397 domain-containing protein [Streptomyces sp. MBT56]|uniref:DUF397 domain-containing protein n=1 Tax=unclassified Streptomyces TaxID=2593676 RepID=UPI00190D271C|nr:MULTISPECIES: DUF397 domain-containing protein [unclassified Streptomyces]MBK3559303.1 DUF397 domain-containing protein [Streptomyces sp. MBT56]MBK3601026.1 DUF397 domain-containing protein [Streptomyces sp. MBT54]MBK3613932.1 DUF397 domain-containing protein [Streptomyces sp. MBT98]MBK6042003.1 DUF397 domain-containing protein [Streptomyces sp. MBT55]
MRADWFKSSYSAQNGGCVETRLRGDVVGCRDSKDTTIPSFSVQPETWQRFVDNVKTRGDV